MHGVCACAHPLHHEVHPIVNIVGAVCAGLGWGCGDGGIWPSAWMPWAGVAP